MFSLLETKKDIADAQRKLEITIRRDFKTKTFKNVGYPGGTDFDVQVNTDGRYWFWSRDTKSNAANPRRLNWFGLFAEGSDLQISVEINTPFEEHNNQIAGFFGRDSNTGAIYLFHSGRVGGGKRGVGKEKFLAWSNLPMRKVVNASGAGRSGVLVMPIEGKWATRSAIRYIDTIARFKREVRAGTMDNSEFQNNEKLYREFYSEPRGRRKGKRSSEIDYVSRHGDVLDALESWRNSLPLAGGAHLVKNVFVDMGVESGHKLTEVYEIKTDTRRANIYAAIGQLMVHGTARRCERFMLLPKGESIPADLMGALQRLKIKLLRFRLEEMKAEIV